MPPFMELASSFFTNATQTANLLTNALRGAGLKITSSNPAAARIPTYAPAMYPPAAGDNNPNVTLNPVFNFVTDNGTSTPAGVVTFQEQTFSGIGAAATGTGGNSSRILLGTLTYTGFATGSTTLTFGDNNARPDQPPSAQQNSALGNEASPATNGGAVLDPVSGGVSQPPDAGGSARV